MSKIPLHPPQSKRFCWGCGYPADDLTCGNGTIRTAHPCELLGDDWLEGSLAERKAVSPRTGPAPVAGTP